MSLFKVEAMGDVMYIEADDKTAAQKQLMDFCGDIPASMLKWSEVEELPDGEEIL